MTRWSIAPALALVCLIFTLTTPPASAKQCAQVTPPGTFKVSPCPPGYQGRAVKRDRKHFRAKHKARRAVVSHRLRAGVGAQTDNDGRPIVAAAYQADPVAHAEARRQGRAAHRGVSIVGIVAPLAAKAAEIASVCGSKVISGIRHTLVAGTRTLSLHASGRAVDMAGNPSCIYRMLAGWPGGFSTDYGRVRHVHISYGGREYGLRFAHGGRRHAKRANKLARI